MIFFFFSLVVCLFIFVKSFKIVNSSEVLIIERLGKYYKTALPGLNIIWPFIDKVRARVDLREQNIDIQSQFAITKDNITVRIDTIVFYQILNAARSVYEVQNLTNSINYLTQTVLRDIIGKMYLNDILKSRDTINAQLDKILNSAVDKWGCQINRVQIKNINLPKDIQDEFERNSSVSKKTLQTYEYSTFFKQTIQPGDTVRVLKVDGSNITIEKID